MEVKKIYPPGELMPSEPIHPGEMLKDELQVRGISQREFASIIGVSHTVLNEVLNRKRPITTEYALKIEAATGTKAYVWINMQTMYNIQIARHDNRLMAILEKIRESVAIL